MPLQFLWGIQVEYNHEDCVCVQDGYSDYAWIFFVLLIVAGSVIIINLFLAGTDSKHSRSPLHNTSRAVHGT
eukprot:COSAG05_NODE_2950_length_2473_cov_60.232098_2_plen_72_part_00